MAERTKDQKPILKELAESKTSKSNSSMVKKEIQVNKGAWTAEEDQKLAQVISIHGAKRWKTIAAIAGLNRCGKSCRLRWLNYLRPNIKRGNISDQEEDLILRLHKLLGNRWSLIAGRLPGRTDNEIKNYWNSHLSKKINTERSDNQRGSIKIQTSKETTSEGETNIIKNYRGNISDSNNCDTEGKYGTALEGSIIDRNNSDFDVDDFFDFSGEGPLNLEWMSGFLEIDRA